MASTGDSAGNGNSPAELAGLISEADRTYLSGQLSPQVMDVLMGVLGELPPALREQLVGEVRVEAEVHGDDAFGLALARVAHGSATRAREGEP